MKSWKFNISNVLTIIRIAISPLVFAGIYVGGHWTVIAAVLFILGAITDWLDGYLARKNKEVTGFGQFADPVADKMLSGFALSGIAATGLVHIWPVVGIIFRDVLITSFRLWGMKRGKKILPSKLAKAKTAIEMLTIISIMIYAIITGENSAFGPGNIAMIAVFILAWITCIDYFWKNRAILI